MAIPLKFNKSNPNHIKVTVECGRWKQVWLCGRDNAVECLEGTLRFLDRVEPVPDAFLPTVSAVEADACFDLCIGKRDGG
jgi:hypothetical protein